jgi:hypothetical protein
MIAGNLPVKEGGGVCECKKQTQPATEGSDCGVCHCCMVVLGELYTRRRRLRKEMKGRKGWEKQRQHGEHLEYIDTNQFKFSSFLGTGKLLIEKIAGQFDMQQIWGDSAPQPILNY